MGHVHHLIFPMKSKLFSFALTWIMKMAVDNFSTILIPTVLGCLTSIFQKKFVAHNFVTKILSFEWSTLVSLSTELSETSHPHYASKLVAYKNKPLAVGHFEYYDGNNKVETYDFNAKTWSELESYPFHTE